MKGKEVMFRIINAALKLHFTINFMPKPMETNAVSSFRAANCS